MVGGDIMLKTVSAIKARQNFGLVMNEIALKSDEYIVERAGKPLVAIIPIEKYLSMKNEREAFYSLYDSIQAGAVVNAESSVDDDIAAAVAAARQ